MRLVRCLVILAVAALSSLFGLQAAPVPGAQAGFVEAVLDFSHQRDRRPSLGIFPPTEVVAPERLSALGVKRVRQGLLPEGLFVETRRAPDGAYVTQYGDDLFLTQRLLAARSSRWTLLVPQGTAGTIRVGAARVGEATALGVERAGEFARLEWTDGEWSYVFFDVSGAWGIERLLELARSLE